jgi:chromosome segregation protein
MTKAKRAYVSSAEQYFLSVRTIISAVKSGIFSRDDVFGTVADIIRVDEKHCIAVQTALGTAIQSVVVANDDVAMECISYLEENNAGRATFLPANSVKGNPLNLDEYVGLVNENGYIGLGHEIVGCDSQFSEVVKLLLGRCVFAENIGMAAVIAKRYGYKFKVVTLGGEIINVGGMFNGGAIKKTRANQRNCRVKTGRIQ